MRRLSLALALVFSLLAPIASADIAPPDRESCDGKKVGDACRILDGDGTCQTRQCSRTLPSPEGPKTETWECLRCVPGAPGDKPDGDKPDGETSKVDSHDTTLAFGAGAGVLLLGLFAARRFGRAE